jgi:hypothetical protein
VWDVMWQVVSRRLHENLVILSEDYRLRSKRQPQSKDPYIFWSFGSHKTFPPKQNGTAFRRAALPNSRRLHFLNSRPNNHTLSSRRTSSAISPISPTILTRTEFCSIIPIANRALSSRISIARSTTAVNEGRNCSRRIPSSIRE